MTATFNKQLLVFVFVVHSSGKGDFLENSRLLLNFLCGFRPNVYQRQKEEEEEEKVTGFAHTLV